MITNVLALTVLAIIVALTGGELNTVFWIKLVVLYLTFSAVIIFLFPVVARWFLKRYSDNISQYIFVLVLVFLGGVLSKFAGIEAIIGAFLAGLSLNRLIPRTSPLMNRIDFVGNADLYPLLPYRGGNADRLPGICKSRNSLGSPGNDSHCPGR